VKLVHLVCFIIKKFVTMHGHTNIKHMTVLAVVIYFEMKFTYF